MLHISCILYIHINQLVHQPHFTKYHTFSPSQRVCPGAIGANCTPWAGVLQTLHRQLGVHGGEGTRNQRVGVAFLWSPQNLGFGFLIMNNSLLILYIEAFLFLVVLVVSAFETFLWPSVMIVSISAVASRSWSGPIPKTPKYTTSLIYLYACIGFLDANSSLWPNWRFFRTLPSGSLRQRSEIYSCLFGRSFSTKMISKPWRLQLFVNHIITIIIQSGTVSL